MRAVERQIVFFAGPKEYRTLARIGEQFQNRADLVMGFGSFWGFFSKALLVGMNWLHDATRLGYGWAIVLITVIIKVVFWPLTAASTRSMKRMQVLAPELKALQEKYKNDMQKLTQKQWELYRKTKGQPDERLPADGHSNARVHRLFHDDSERHRTARRAFPLGRGFVEAGHAVHDSGDQFPIQPAAFC